ncbi:MAG: hypothetical protein CL534_07855 [Ahrensia sp.]|nr:hypothetical protein [Ahrensia sp.]
MTSYLLIIANREALGWILTEGRMAFPNERRAEVRSLKAGDELFLYTTRGAFKKPARDRGRIIGTARVASQVVRLEEAVAFDNREYPVGCKLEIGPLAPFGHGVELAPLIPQLSTFDGVGKVWSIKLRRPLVRITADDSALLHRALDKVGMIGDGGVDRVRAYARWFLS